MQSRSETSGWTAGEDQRSEGRSTPPHRRVARAMTAPGSVRSGGIIRRQAISRRKGTSSRFRGVTHHCRTGRWEAHIWEDGKQIYLGGFDNEEQAALAYDIAAIKFRAHDANTNYNISNYQQELLHFDEVSKEEVVQSLRKQSRGAQKTSSQYRGVTKHQKGKWEARIGQMVGRKYKYLGLFKDEIEAAIAYDREAVKRRGIHAVTNFDLSEYKDLLDADSIAEAEACRLFKAKPSPEAVTTETPQGLYFTQVAEPMQQDGAFADMQLLQTPMSHASDDNAVSNLQQYGSYMVVSPSTASAPVSAMQSSYSIADHTDAANHHTQGVSHTTPAMQNSYSATNNSDAAYHHAQGVNEPMTGMDGAAVVWYGPHQGEAALHNQVNAAGIAAGYGQPLVHYTAVAKKGTPGDVSRHDTPTSVFDIFNSLSIMPPSPTGQAGHPPHDHHDVSLGQEPALTDLPHLSHVNTTSYQAMIVEDDDWLHDFAAIHSSPTASAAAAAAAAASAAGSRLSAGQEGLPPPDYQNDQGSSAESCEQNPGNKGADGADADEHQRVPNSQDSNQGSSQDGEHDVPGAQTCPS